MDIKVLHIDSNHSYCGIIVTIWICNHSDFTSSKEKAKINEYQGIVIRSRLKLTKHS
jgi:hypothetical protein